MKKNIELKRSKVKPAFRKMNFAFKEKGFSKYWHDQSPFKSFFWASLSAAFPSGERFFMDSARALRKVIDDPELVAEIGEFCLQEAHHTYQHLEFNKLVAEQGFNMDKYDGRFAKVLGKVQELLDPMGMLAVTAALEHFTAGIAQQILGNPEINRGADPNVAALWTWHSAEETEHKGTCFDTYQRAGGNYALRVTVLPIAWFLILTITFRNLVDMLLEDGKLLNVRGNLRGLSYLFGTRGLITRMLPSFFDYFRPSFHPWDNDNGNLIEEWERANSHYIVSKKVA